MSNKYPNSGRLNYSKRKIHPKSPDLYGDIVFERSYLRTLLQETEGDDILVRLDAWQNDGQYGTFFQLKVNTWKKTEPAVEAPKPPADDSDVPF
jgi:hypothetical protein